MNKQKRILVVNPNTSPEVTSAYVKTVAERAPHGVRLIGITGTFGARIVSTEPENVIAAYSALELTAEHADGVDGVILAISFDSGLAAVQELPVPVVGITQAAVLAASRIGRNIGVNTFGKSSRPLYERLIAGYGVQPVGYADIEFDSVGDYLAPDAKDASVLAAVETLGDAGADVVLICGAAIVGMAGRLAAQSAIPLVDGGEALGVCLARISSDLTRIRARPVGPSINLSEKLARLLVAESSPRS